ncbi:MAG: 16S rRNA (cytosine(967)-C(5))-methyltransferase RsmB [Deltaproteobacteria bacterium]|nr:MAG: 16S rRNA (cytosine(967)-C(5))-methyltransferase RsmB [Deltaproteobacteria bacterium]
MKKASRGARYIAIEILCGWEESRLPVDQLIEQNIPQEKLADPRDRQLILSLVYGVIRWRGYLDWVISKYSKHPLSKMKSRTLQALRVGVFQLLFLDRVPDSAAINETVQALKDMKQPKWLTGFVNGLLRSVDREREDIPGPLKTKTEETLPEAALLSHPEWLIKRWKHRYGQAEAHKICQENNKRAPICLRVNTKLTSSTALLEKLRNHGLNVEAGKFSSLALKLHDYRGSITTIPGFAAGLFQVQDEAAQLVSLLLGPQQPGKSYLDGCAGLGGKTSHLAQMLAPNSRLVAVEPNPGRIKKLQENLGRLQLDTTVTIVEGTLDLLLHDNKGRFAGVLIDAPCSGLGVIRRHPDIRWNRKPEDLSRYQEMQVELLKIAAELIATQGILVYATCSMEPEENDEVIEQFLASHKQFALSDCRDMLPEPAACLVDSQGFFRTLPGRDDLDGFFAARLIKIKN